MNPALELPLTPWLFGSGEGDGEGVDDNGEGDGEGEGEGVGVGVGEVGLFLVLPVMTTTASFNPMRQWLWFPLMKCLNPDFVSKTLVLPSLNTTCSCPTVLHLS